MMRSLFLLCLLSLSARSQGSSDDKFIKKYAMMKIYESCFGPEVVKQIRKEMKDAYEKCSAPPSFDEPPNQQVPSILLGKLPPGFAIDPNTKTITKPQDGAMHNQENDLHLQSHKVTPLGNILPFRQAGPFPNPFPPSPYPVPGVPGVPGQFRPYAQPFSQYPYNPMFYPGMYNPYFQQDYQQYMPEASPYGRKPFFLNSRISRDLDLRDRLELVSRGPNAGKVRNITCVMQELGYIDSNLEPNYEQITQRISNLPVSSELKGDIQDGLQFCQKFSQCVPEVKRDMAPLSQELIKPMFFFRCYKHKKLEACIMKDIRERFTNEEELDTDSDIGTLSRSARSLRDPLSDPRLEALDEMAVYLYDYLSGGNGLDYDLYL